ncbi:MAG: TIGR02281 family clan AA aspartic protease [Rhodobacteraceae bacterium]|nr:TIGR02281 family clan AA aspartic protease [Paracoccaceae bacterium]
MTGDDIGQLLFLSLWAVALLGAFLVSNRMSWGKTAQYAAIWGLIFVGAIAIVGLWGDIRGNLSLNQTRFQGEDSVVVDRQLDGHYYLTLEVNDVPVPFMIDTGASEMVLTREDAARVGLSEGDLNFIGRANTANGIVRTAPVRLDEVRLGQISDQNVYAVVNDGEMTQSLLGMGYLQNWGRIEIADGRLRLSR